MFSLALVVCKDAFAEMGTSSNSVGNEIFVAFLCVCVCTFFHSMTQISGEIKTKRNENNDNSVATRAIPRGIKSG